jgi:hypothetical protein
MSSPKKCRIEEAEENTTTCFYDVFHQGEKIGSVYITGCPKQLAGIQALADPGAGHDFLVILDAIFRGRVDDWRFSGIVIKDSILDPNICCIPWSVAKLQLEEESQFE